MPESKLTETSLETFAGVLAAKVSVPGGGGAAAYVGALSAALCSMTGEFTRGKKRYAAYEDDIVRMLAEAQAARERFVTLVNEDAAAFEPLSRAYGIPRDDPSRAEVLESATKGALAAPIAMMDEIAHVIELLEEMDEKGSRLLISDVGCGAALAAAALKAASLNVFINTKTLADRAYATEVEAHCDALLTEYVARAEAVETHVMKYIREGN